MKGALRALSSPMASDKMTVPINRPPTPNHTRDSTLIANTALLIIIMDSNPKRLANMGATSAPNANIGMGNAPNSPMADTDSPSASVSVGATEPSMTMGERIFIANSISVMMSRVRGKVDFGVFGMVIWFGKDGIVTGFGKA